MATNRINYFRKYIKNVGKSFGYAATDILKEYNPIVTDVFSSTKGAVSSTYNQIKDFAFSSHSESEKSLLGEIKDASRGAFSNLLDDLKTGNWYNKARDDAADEDMMKALGFDMSDFDFDFNFDEDSWGEGDDSFTATAKSEMAEDKRNTAATIASMNMVGNRVASAVNEGTVRSANYISNTIRESNKALYDLNQRGFSQTLLGINTINSTLAEFANKIGTPLTAHMQNATVFYTKTSEQLTKIEQHLATIVQNTTIKTAEQKGYKGNKKPGMEDLLSSSGLDLNRYFDFVKGSLSEYKETAQMIMNFAKGSLGVGSKSGRSNLSIGKSLITGGLKAMIPEMFKQSMENFNKSLGDFLAGALVKASRSSPSNLGLDILKDLLVPSNYFKKGIDTSSYEKGAIAWDGKARKALVEVIPTTLFKILGALTGKEQRYDYNTGKFVDIRSIKQSQEDMLRRNARTAGGDFRSKAQDLARARAKGNKALEAQYLDEIENYFYNAYADDYGYKNFDKIGRKDFDKKKFGIKSDEVVKILRAIVASGKADSYFRTNASMRSQQRRELLEAERSGDHIFTALANGSIDFSGKAGKNGAKLGFFNKGTLGYYIKGIYEHTGYIATNLSKLGGGAPISGSGETTTFAKFGEFDPTKTRRVIKLADASKREAMAQKLNSSNLGAGEKHRDDVNRKLGLSDFATEDEYNKYIREEQGKETKAKLTKAQQNIKDKISSLFKGLPRSMKNIFDAPFNAAARVLDTISTGFSTFLWGDPTGSDKGFFGTVKDKLSDTFKSVTDSLKDETKGWFKRAFEAIFGKKDETTGKRVGGFFGTGFGEEIKKELGSAGTWLSDTGREILYGTKYAEAYKANRDNGTAARGRRVTRSGIVAVSEGEMIIPSDFNPYYHGSNDKNVQIRRELANRNRFFAGKGGLGATSYIGNYAGGTDVDIIERRINKNGKPYYYNTTTRKMTNKAAYESYLKYLDSLKSRTKYNKDTRQLTRNIGTEEYDVGGFLGLLNGASNKAYDIGVEVKDRFFDDDGTDASRKAAKERDKQAILAGLSTLGKEAKINRGAIGAGAILGAGASLLTGGVVGPLMGASIGAAAGLTIRSATVQKFLFGDEDHDGLFKKEFGEKLKKYVPTMAKGAVVGGVGGLFMGSPVMGAIVGSSIGYIYKSEKAQQFLFGTPDDPKLLGKVRDKVKERIPGMTLGAIGGLLAGPSSLGVVGNLVLGSGIGYLATSEKTKEFFLGKKGENGKRVGGFLYDIKSKVFDNINELFHNLMNSTKGFGKKLLRRVSRHSKNLLSSITKSIAKRLRKTKTGSKIANLAKSIPGGIVNAAGRITGAISNKWKKHDLSHGYDVWDSRLGRNLTAEERMGLRKEKGFNQGNAYSKFDEILAQATSEKDLDEISRTIDAVANPDKTAKQLKNNAITSLYNGLSDSVNANKIARMMSSGDYKGALASVTDENDKKVIENARDLMEQSRNQAFNSKMTLAHFHNLGINLNKDELGNLQDLIKTERTRFKGEKEKEENQPGSYRFRVIHALENIAENVAAIGMKDEAPVKAPDGNTNGKEEFNKLVGDWRSQYSAKERRDLFDKMKSLEQGEDFAKDDKYVQRLNEINDIYSPENMENLSGFERARAKFNRRGELMLAGLANTGTNLKNRFSRAGAAVAASYRQGVLRDAINGMVDVANLNPIVHINRNEDGINDSISPGYLYNGLAKLGEKVYNIEENIKSGIAGIPGSIGRSISTDMQRDRDQLEKAKAKRANGEGRRKTTWNGRKMTWNQVYNNLKHLDRTSSLDESLNIYAYGSPFTRRGLASVSEGELILPYYGNFANGTISNGQFLDSLGRVGNIKGSDDIQNAFGTHINFIGDPMEYKLDNQRKPIIDTSDRETLEAKNKMDNFINSITSMSKLSAAQLALAGAGYGLSADELKKLAGAGSGTSDSPFSLGNLLNTAVSGLGTLLGGGLIFKGVKSIANKLLFGQSNTKGLSLSEKINQFKLKHNIGGAADAKLRDIYSNQPLGGSYDNEAYIKQYNKDAWLNELDDAQLDELGVKFNSETGYYEDIKTGEQFDATGAKVNANTAAEAVKASGLTNPFTEGSALGNYWKNSTNAATGETSYDLFKNVDKFDDEAKALGTTAQQVKNSTKTSWLSKTWQGIKNLGTKFYDAVAGTKTGRAILTGASEVSNKISGVGKTIATGAKAVVSKGAKVLSKIGKVLKILPYVIGAIQILGAIIGVIKDYANHMTTSEIEQFVQNEISNAEAKGYMTAFMSPKDFKAYVESNPSAYTYFALHPVAALIRLKGPENFESNSCLKVFPYMLMSDAMYTLQHEPIYEKARFAAGSGWKTYFNNPYYQMETHNVETNIINRQRFLKSLSIIMVKDYEYYRAYTTAIKSELFDRSKIAENLGLNLAVTTLNSAFSFALDFISFGLVSKGDLSSKGSVITKYDYTKDEYKSANMDKILPKSDSMFTDLKLDWPEYDSEANSGLDQVKGLISGIFSGGDLNMGSNTYGNSNDIKNIEYIDINKDEMRAKAYPLMGLVSAVQYYNAGTGIDLPSDIYDTENMYYSEGGIPMPLTGYNDPNDGSFDYTTVYKKYHDAIDNNDQKAAQWINDVYNFHYNKKSFSKMFKGKEDTYFNSYYYDDKMKDYWNDISAAYASGGRSGLNRLRYPFGAGSFVSQNSKMYKGISYGNSNIGDIGCAPAAASNLVSALGGHLSMKDAINVGKKYVNGNGTSINYFSDILSKSGYGSRALDSKSDIVNSLAHNNPVVMLGKDETNNSKLVSSYGPNSHYIVGTGINPDGSVNVLDSENNGPMNYDLKKILDGTYAAISGGHSGAKDEADAKAKDYEAWLKKSAKDTSKSDNKSDDTSSGGTGDSYHSNAKDEMDHQMAGYNDWAQQQQNQATYTGVAGALNYIRNKFAQAFGSSTGSSNGTYGTYGTNTTGGYDYSSGAVGGVPTGGINNTKQAELVQYANSRLDKEAYDQGRREQTINNQSVLPGIDMFSDCSSFARRAYKNVLGVDIGSYTGAQISKLRDGTGPNVIVDESTNKRRKFTDFAQPGDLVYFNGGTKGSSVNHVEMYVGDNKFIGQDASGKYSFRSEEYFSDRADKDYKSKSGPSLKNDAYEYRRTTSTGDRYMLTARFKDIAKYGSTYHSNAKDAADAEARARYIYEASQKSAKDMSKDEVKKAIWNYFKGAGYTDEATAAIMGNIQLESDFDPTNVTVEPNKAKNWAAGLFQWHDKRSYDNGNYTYVNSKGNTVTQTPERFGQLSKLAKERGLDWTSPVLQMEFADKELMNLNPRWMNLNYSTKDTALANASVNNFTKRGLSASDSVNPSDFRYLTNVDKATAIFDAGFERSDGNHVNLRQKYAKNILNEFKGSGSGLKSPKALYSTKHRRSANLYGGASAILDQDYMTRDTKKLLDGIQTAIVAKGNSGEMSQDIVAQLMMAIIEILKAIAMNTVPVGDIYSKLSSYSFLTGGGATTAASRNEQPSKQKYHKNGTYINKSSFEPSAALKTLVTGLASFAKG